MAEKNCFDMTKLIFQIIYVTVVQWSSSCLNVQINRVRLLATLFSVSLYRFFFFFCLVSFFNTVFSFGLCVIIILTADPAGHALGSIYILSLSPEFYFGKGISKALDLHTGQAYDQIKTISCQDMSLLWNSWFFSMLVDITTNTHSAPPQTVLIYTEHPPVTHWRKLNLRFVHRLNHQYYYPKISTRSVAPKK